MPESFPTHIIDWRNCPRKRALMVFITPCRKPGWSRPGIENSGTLAHFLRLPGQLVSKNAEGHNKEMCVCQWSTHWGLGIKGRDKRTRFTEKFRLQSFVQKKTRNHGEDRLPPRLCCPAALRLGKRSAFLPEIKCFMILAFLIPGDDSCPITKIQDLGCYNQGSIPLFTQTLSMNSNNSVLNCTGRCREAGFTYAAMLNGTGCSCGNLQPLASHRRELNECNVRCPGDTNKKCGGAAGRITAYYVEPFGRVVNSVCFPFCPLTLLYYSRLQLAKSYGKYWLQRRLPCLQCAARWVHRYDSGWKNNILDCSPEGYWLECPFHSWTGM